MISAIHKVDHMYTHNAGDNQSRNFGTASNSLNQDYQNYNVKITWEMSVSYCCSAPNAAKSGHTW